MSYDPIKREAYWQNWWNENKVYDVDLDDKSKPLYYNLTMFPYPSGDRLHLGHWYNYAPLDSWGRFMKLQGYNVFQPMGFDSFGLPAENYAIKTGVHPRETTMTNIKKMTEQLSNMGAMWNWDQKVVTSEPDYYKWSQWLFLELYKDELAYRKKSPVNWCPSCHTVLANEQVDNGFCERCKSEVTKKNLTQWFFKITDYAEKLLDYSGLNWPEKTILMQKNWISRSEGSEVEFSVFGDIDEKLRVYTTRPDTLFGTTFIVLAPEHPLVDKLTTDTYKEEIKAYQNAANKITDIERTSTDREKTGVFTGSYVINPATRKKIPVYVGDFVLIHYGTGCVMATPGHDERDNAFAKKYKLPIIQVVAPTNGDEVNVEEAPYTEYGLAVNSEFLNGKQTEQAKKIMIEWLEEQKIGEGKVNYKLRDWLISRQRYWGAPIPIVYDPEGNSHPVPEKHLPWLLPTDVEFKPTGTSPLAQSKELIERTEKIFGKGWTPEVDTMDTFICSSWYYLRYLSNNESEKIIDTQRAKDWLPVDMYIGGPEHACMHLLYARFINMFLHEKGLSPKKEPFKKLVHQGMITKDGAKMSKSKGNVVSPDAFVEKYGADVLRMYLMFMGPYTEGGDWNDQGITGIARFVKRFYKMILENETVDVDSKFTPQLHKTIKKVTEDIEKLQFNTALAGLMELTNFGLKHGKITEEAREALTILIAPLAPHLAEELWHGFGYPESIFTQKWPSYDPEQVVEDTITLIIQVNGKLRAKLSVSKDITKKDAIAQAKADENVLGFIQDKEIVKEIFVPGKLVSLVVK